MPPAPLCPSQGLLTSARLRCCRGAQRWFRGGSLAAAGRCPPRGERVLLSRDTARCWCGVPLLAGDTATGRDRKLRRVSGSGADPVSREPAAYPCWAESPGSSAVGGTGTRFAVLSVCWLFSSACFVTCKTKCRGRNVSGLKCDVCHQGCPTFRRRL